MKKKHKIYFRAFQRTGIYFILFFPSFPLPHRPLPHLTRNSSFNVILVANSFIRASILFLSIDS